MYSWKKTVYSDSLNNIQLLQQIVVHRFFRHGGCKGYCTPTWIPFPQGYEARALAIT